MPYRWRSGRRRACAADTGNAMGFGVGMVRTKVSAAVTFMPPGASLLLRLSFFSAFLGAAYPLRWYRRPPSTTGLIFILVLASIQTKPSSVSLFAAAMRSGRGRPDRIERRRSHAFQPCNRHCRANYNRRSEPLKDSCARANCGVDDVRSFQRRDRARGKTAGFDASTSTRALRVRDRDHLPALGHGLKPACGAGAGAGAGHPSTSRACSTAARWA